jgi:hypothetical protein
VAPGEVAVVPPGVPHAWRSVGDDELHLLLEFRPALRTERLFEALYGLARSGRTNPRGMPNPLQLSVLMRDHLEETCAPIIPIRVQPAIIGALAAIGRRAATGQPTPFWPTSVRPVLEVVRVAAGS